MKNTLKIPLALLVLTGLLEACRGGFSGEKQDSTMLNRERMDSIAALNSKAGTMAADSNSAAKYDSAHNSNKDTTLQ